MDMTLYIRRREFFRHHIRDVHETLELDPIGKVLLPRSHQAFVTRVMSPPMMFTKLIPLQAVNIFPMSSIDLC